MEEKSHLIHRWFGKRITNELLSLCNFAFIFYSWLLSYRKLQHYPALAGYSNVRLVRARSVVRGYEQTFTDTLTSSPTPSWTTLSLLLTVVIITDLEIHTGDVSAAFLYAHLLQDNYVLPSKDLL